MKRYLAILAVWLAIAVSLFFLCDAFITKLYYRPIAEETRLLEKSYRISNPVYHHGINPSFHGQLLWGRAKKYEVYSNTLGMKDSRIRHVSLKKGNKRRLLIIGDSFAEGVGLPWEKTFAGQFAEGHPDQEVLNASVSGYSPSVYYNKIKYLLDEGLEVDEIIIFIDISDVQDEVYYRDDELGNLLLKESAIKESRADWAIDSLRENLFLTYTALRGVKAIFRMVSSEGVGRRIYNLDRALWTLKELPEWKHVEQAYLPLGIDGAISKAMKKMDNLFALLTSKGIAMSVAVYPWPSQLYYNDEDSLQVKVWSGWCKGKCNHFINMFPDFFEVKRARKDWYEYLFLNGDVHFNEQGHRLVSERLAKVYGDHAK